jgi:hypothetical protein
VLTDYLKDTAALLRDANYLFNSQTQLTRYINLARQQVAQVTGCIRCHIPGQSPFGISAVPGSFTPGAAQPGAATTQQFTTISGVEKYHFGYAKSFLQAGYEGVDSVMDVIDLTVSWGGNQPCLNWLPWEDLQAYARSYNAGVFSYPFLWSTNGSGTKGQIWLFPVPQVTADGTIGSAGYMEWDTTCLPSFIYSDDDYEAIPEPFIQAVKFYAAHLAFLGSQRYGMAEIMKALFYENLDIENTASDRGKTSSFYWGP